MGILHKTGVFLLGALLILVYWSASIRSMPGVVVLLIGAALLTSMLLLLWAHHSTSVSLFILMAYTIPISWRNVFGGSFEALPVPWLYLLGALYFIANFLEAFKNRRQMEKLPIFVTGIIFLIAGCMVGASIFNLHSAGLSDNFGQLVTVLYFLFMLVAAILQRPFQDIRDFDSLTHAYFNAAMITGLCVLAQAVMYFSLGYRIPRIDVFGGSRVAFGFLFSDYSHESLYLASAGWLGFISSYGNARKKHVIQFYVGPLFLLFASVLTSARTGIAAFLIAFFLFALTRENAKERWRWISMTAFVGAAALGVFLLVRPMSLSALLDSSGRTSGYLAGLRAFLERPLTGIGLGRLYARVYTGEMIPHFTLIQYLLQTGIITTSLMAILWGMVLYHGFRIKDNPAAWAALLTMIGSCFIPDIFSSRFFIWLSMGCMFTMNHRVAQTILKEAPYATQDATSIVVD